ncbi:hypothetical protein Godav_010269 [Gossypium davidsonii]|uniref:Large ribosomal subunit protein mL46 n=1 Tax=Gossypium davidsonii TaxID=34287 RepID=A0A7J8SGT0_GOSDV|nr:hypothetical protein [Gossypium davidsonii]
MHRSLVRPFMGVRGFSSTSKKIVASVLFERLPVVIPKLDPVVYAFKSFRKFSFSGKGDYQIDNVPAPRITEADKKIDRNNAAPSRKPVWHFPEKVYDSEETLRKCAESALAFVLGDLSHTYFVGNAPMGHMVIQQMENVPEPSKRFFFKSQVIDTNKFDIQKCEDFVWVTKNELLEYFPEQAEFFKKLIIS